MNFKKSTYIFWFYPYKELDLFTIINCLKKIQSNPETSHSQKIPENSVIPQ